MTLWDRKFQIKLWEKNEFLAMAKAGTKFLMKKAINNIMLQIKKL